MSQTAQYNFIRIANKFDSGQVGRAFVNQKAISVCFRPLFVVLYFPTGNHLVRLLASMPIDLKESKQSKQETVLLVALLNKDSYVLWKSLHSVGIAPVVNSKGEY